MVCVGDTMYLAVQDLAMFSDHVFTTIWFADLRRGGSLAPDGSVHAYGPNASNLSVISQGGVTYLASRSGT
ncbi:hypothetical protein [Kribbella sindirgiensis]|uniref:Uncharacterized protein n=1 Tax=Kribbella sindirgiensis TaxID=1124744 RepID=A0A4R0J5E7_9ACTN|nr:hypothetical protein [Kribbella sindirgiensis]TCC39536.1 hypothetical protein E0H50_06300 [Kribbella sindirgiensis]